MSPTYTMSAHMCKQIYKAFQNRQTPLEPSSTTQVSTMPSRRSPSPDKRISVDSNRSDSSPGSMSPAPGSPSSSPSNSVWGWGKR